MQGLASPSPLPSSSSPLVGGLIGGSLKPGCSNVPGNGCYMRSSKHHNNDHNHREGRMVYVGVCWCMSEIVCIVMHQKIGYDHSERRQVQVKAMYICVGNISDSRLCIMRCSGVDWCVGDDT